MKTSNSLNIGVLAIAVVSILAVLSDELSSQQSASVRIDNDDIGGVVNGPSGP